MHVLNMHEVKKDKKIYVYVDVDVDYNVAPLQIKMYKCYIDKSNDAGRFF
jgi:hypothetical protein